MTIVLQSSFAANMMTTHRLAAAGDTTVKEDLLRGKQFGNLNYNVHLDGYNLMPFLKGEEERSSRASFVFWTDDGDVAALPCNN